MSLKTSVEITDIFLFARFNVLRFSITSFNLISDSAWMDTLHCSAHIISPKLYWQPICRPCYNGWNSDSFAALLFALLHTDLIVVEVADRQALLLNTTSMASLELPSNCLGIVFKGEGGLNLWRISGGTQRNNLEWSGGWRWLQVHSVGNVEIEIDCVERVFGLAGGLRVCAGVRHGRDRHELQVRILRCLLWIRLFRGDRLPWLCLDVDDWSSWDGWHGHEGWGKHPSSLTFQLLHNVLLLLLIDLTHIVLLRS